MRYVSLRVLTALPMIFILISVLFLVLRVLPGDPAIALLGQQASEAQLEAVRHAYGLDQPLYVQYERYWVDLLKGDFGLTIDTRVPVISEIERAFPTTLELTIGATISAALFGISMGALSCWKRDRWPDHVIRAANLIFFSIPVFWAGILGQLVFGRYLGILPIYGRLDPGLTVQRITGMYVLDSILTGNIPAFADSIWHLLLPCLTLGMFLGALISRLTRSNLVDALGESYVFTARAKGLSEGKVILDHALPNALLPVISILGLQVAGLIGGAVVTETVFSLPGIGTRLVLALLTRDYGVVQATVIIFALTTTIASIVVDVLYSILDPRVRY